jgi:HAD superfamily hydrolase (TIGR01509 family)
MASVDFSAVDTVLLDMDGTLLDLSFDNFFWQQLIPAHYAREHGHDEASARQRVFDLYRSRLGTLDWYCLDHWSEELGIDIAALKRRHLDRVGFLPDVPAFLAALRRYGLRTVIATNAHGTTLALKLSVTGLTDLVDEVHTSHDYRAPKEQVLFWQQFRQRVGFDPARSLLIDDNLAVLAAARRFGVSQLLAIRRPDSTLAPHPVTEFAAIDGVGELTPLLERLPPPRSPGTARGPVEPR